MIIEDLPTDLYLLISECMVVACPLVWAGYASGGCYAWHLVSACTVWCLSAGVYMGRILAPVACSPVNSHQGGQYAHKEEDQHHVLAKCIVLSWWTPPTEEIFFIFKVSSVASEPSSCPWFIQILQVVVVDNPGINTELVLFRLVTSRRKLIA